MQLCISEIGRDGSAHDFLDVSPSQATAPSQSLRQYLRPWPGREDGEDGRGRKGAFTELERNLPEKTKKCDLPKYQHIACGMTIFGNANDCFERVLELFLCYLAGTG